MGILEKPIYNLLQTQPFYANFILASRIVLNSPKVERAAASIRNNEIVFYFNPDWYSTLTTLEQVAILQHEVLHILLDHCNLRSQFSGNHKAKNISMDCAINQFINNLPENCVTLESLEELCEKKLRPKETWEYYYEHLKQAVEDYQNGQGDDHDMMDGDPNDSWTDAIKKAIIRDQAAKAMKASAGIVPDGLESILSQLNQPPKVNWKQQLRNLIASARSVNTKSSRLKTHRRFELDQPGKKKKRELVLGVCTDSSGSISDEQYIEFMNEIESISKNTSITYLVHADCEVQKVDVIKGGKAKSGVLSKRHGNGGTAYQPAINECVKYKCNAIVYFGDFDTSDTPTNPGVPFIWVGVGDQKPPADFGRVIRL